MTNLKTIALSAAVIAALTGCGDTTVYQEPSSVTIIGDTTTTGTDTGTDTDTGTTSASVAELIQAAASLPRETLSGELGPVAVSKTDTAIVQATDLTSTNITLTADTLWVLDGLVVVKPGVTLTIEEGTVIAVRAGTGNATSYMIVDKGGKIIADAESTLPIVFTSLDRVEDYNNNDVGQWGGLTIIGHAGNDQVNPYEVNTAYEADATDLADNSGILRHVHILNSGITMETDKEINGLSFIGVGSGTVVSDVTVDMSDDDGIEIWGGTVNLSNITITNCTDDFFDIDDGYSGTVTNLVINTENTIDPGNAAIEMSGTTAATFDGFTITTGVTQAKEGGIYFKNAGIGGHFKNGTIIHNGGVVTPDGALHSNDVIVAENTSFENVAITSAEGLAFTGDSAAALETAFDAGGAAGNVLCSIPTATTLTGELTGCTVLTADKTWELDGLAVVTSGSELRIQEGTTIVGLPGTGDSTSYMIVDKDAKIYALGTEANPIIFTSENTSVQDEGLWGGLTIIGNAGNDQVQAYEVNTLYGGYDAATNDLTDNSGILRHVKILNSGITMAEDKEINGLSLIGVGSGTEVSDITVDYADDDGVEIWGGTVNLSNIFISNCTDDYFDIDDGYSGTVTNLEIVQDTLGNAAIEMSGNTAATFDGFTITQNGSAKEGGIYFKNDGIGGHFKNGTVIDNNEVGELGGAIHSAGVADTGNISFESVILDGTSTEPRFTGDSAADIEIEFNAGTGNTVN